MKRICKLFSSFKHILILCLMILIISTEFVFVSVKSGLLLFKKVFDRYLEFWRKINYNWLGRIYF